MKIKTHLFYDKRRYTIGFSYFLSRDLDDTFCWFYIGLYIPLVTLSIELNNGSSSGFDIT